MEDGIERDADGRMLLNKRPSKYRSVGMVRQLRIARLKETQMSRTAALDVRKAAVLGVTKLPKTKVYGKKKGAFSDFQKMMSSSANIPGGGSNKMPPIDKKKPAAKDAEDDEEEGADEKTPPLTADQQQALLVLSVKDRKPVNARHIGRRDLSDFQKTFDHKMYMDFKIKMNEKIDEITTSIRAKHEKRRKELDAAGFFHPDANRMRCESAFQNELQKKLSMDHVESIVLDEMLRESRGEVLNKTTSALDSKFDKLLSFNSSPNKTKMENVDNSAGKGEKKKKGILKNASQKSVTAASTSAASKTVDGGMVLTATSGSRADTSGADKKDKVRGGKAADEENGPAALLAKETERKVAGGTEKAIRKSIGDQHVKDRGQLTEDVDAEEEARIWDNSSDEEDNATNERAGNSTPVVDGEPQEKGDGKLPTFAGSWDDEIALDDGEGSDIGSELTEDMEVAEEVVKKKKKVKLDSFEIFRRERKRQVRAKAEKRNKALKEGKLGETVDDDDFKDLSKHRSSTVQLVLGSGKHTIERTRVKTYAPLGQKAVNAPLPNFVSKEIRKLGGTVSGDDHEQKSKAVKAKKQRLVAAKAKEAARKEQAESDDSSDDENFYSDEEEAGAVVDEAQETALTEAEQQVRREEKKKRAKARRAKQKREHQANEEDGEPLLRKTLEKIWADLQMPNNQKMEFVIKYTDPSRAEEIHDAIERWRVATMGVCMREMLLDTIRYLQEMAANNEFVSIRILFESDQVNQLELLDVWIPKEDMYDASALTWVKTMEENLRLVVRELLMNLKEHHDDTLTFRGQKYFKILKEHIENPALVPGEPILYTGNPYLRRTGKLLLGR